VLAALIVTAATPEARAAIIPWRSAPHPLLVHALRRDIVLHRARAAARGYRLGVILATGRPERSTVSLVRLRALDSHWRALAGRFRILLARRAPVYAALMCIHSHEGAWTSYSAAGPYYGGMQMSATFEAHYGAAYLRLWGDARHWPPTIQLAAAYRAVMNVGYTPWPASAAACGLL
jgi:hypothetical protein